MVTRKQQHLPGEVAAAQTDLSSPTLGIPIFCLGLLRFVRSSVLLKFATCKPTAFVPTSRMISNVPIRFFWRCFTSRHRRL